MLIRSGLVVTAFFAFNGSAFAQAVPEATLLQVPARRPPPRRVIPRKPARPPRSWYLSGAAIAPSPQPFENTVPVEEFLETGSRALRYETARSPAVDVSAGVQIVRRFFVGGALSGFSGTSSGAITAEIPHPLFFDQKRSLTAEVDDLERQELGIHIQAATIVPISRRFRVMLAGGPTVFRVRQDLVSAIAYRHEYPYDEVTFAGATVESQARTALGFHAQAGLIALFSRRVGADVLVRYSDASAVFDASDGSTFKGPVGGLQIGIGLRAIF